MIKQIVIILFVGYFVESQVLNNVRVIDHREYMSEVISETVREVERREWSSLRIPEIIDEFDEEVINWHLNGTAHYANGFVASIHHVDVLQSSLNQIWSNVGDGTVQVEIRGQLRMTNLSLGFDIDANLNDGYHHYTGLIVHPLVTFDFSIFRNAHTEAMSVTVTGTQPITNNIIRILPMDRVGDALSVLFDPRTTADGVTGWASTVFQPIALGIITTSRVPFPGICYNCAVS